MKRRLLALLPRALARAAARAARSRPPREALRTLFELEADLRVQIDQAAIEYDGGVHPKHRVMRYHDFFVERVRPGERVLDVGCGKGELAYDLAERAGARVTGIDVNRDYLRFARERYAHPEVDFVEADAHEYEPGDGFEVVVLSNVLEHVEDRVGLLRRLLERARPGRVLVRVPAYDRDWRVPLRAELGLFPFDDATHQVEYLPGQLEDELRDAGLEVDEQVRAWGEIWAVAVPRVQG